MSVTRVGVLVVVLGVLLALPTGGVAAAGPKCPRRHAKTLLSDREAIVYSYEETATGFWTTAACAHGHQSVPVEHAFEGGLSDQEVCGLNHDCAMAGWHHTIVLSGTTLAYAMERPGDAKYTRCACNEWRVVVRDLRTGRILHDAATAPYRESRIESQHVGLGPALRVVVDQTGALAWIVRDDVEWERIFSEDWKKDAATDDPPFTYQVRMIAHGHESLLASGTDVDPTALAVHRHRVEWRQGGTAHFAPFP